MDGNIRSVRDRIAVPPIVERRRIVRQKLHTPVYASFNGPQTGMVVDLSELLDLNEDGFAVQTSQRLEVNRPVTVCLDLPETKTYIHCTGQVIWSDNAGRGGIRFSALSEKSQQILKEWLFANLMIGSANHSARAEQMAQRERQKSPEAAPGKSGPRIVPLSEGSATLAAVDAVRLVIRDIGDDFDAILQLVTERAMSFTGAGGAALALLTDGQMVCRARAGEQAPPLGAPVDVTQGLTGECVRRGLLVSCDDTENDPRVDPEVCRALKIGSVMAAPIVSGLHVIGLLEVVSPYRRRFMKVHATVLNRLIELIPMDHRDVGEESVPYGAAHPPSASPTDSKFSSSSGGEEFSKAASVLGNLGPTEPASEQRSESATEKVGAEVGADGLSEVQAEIAQSASPDSPQGNIPEENVPAQTLPSILERAAAAASSKTSRIFYRALIGFAIVAAFVLIGYLVAPIIEKRLATPSQGGHDSMKSSDRNSNSEIRTTIKAKTDTGVPQSGTAPVEQNATQPNSLTDDLAELRQQAAQGNPDAQWQLGARYHNGEGVSQDDAQAMQWFQRAADQGHVMAQATLGAYYWAGRGVPPDLMKAYFWSAVAFAQGDENSKARLDGLTSQMTPAQISAARQQAEAWLRAHNPHMN